MDFSRRNIEALLCRRKDIVRKIGGQPERPVYSSMGVPKPYPLSEKPPKNTPEDHVDLVHVNKDSVVFFSFMDHKPVKMDQVLETRLLFLFSERENANIIWKFIFALEKADHAHCLAVLGKFPYPSMEKAQYWVVFIEFLGGYEKFHKVTSILYHSWFFFEDNSIDKVAPYRY